MPNIAVECWNGLASYLHGPQFTPWLRVAILAEGFRGFSQNFQANVGIIPHIRQIPLQLTRLFPLFTSLLVDPNYNHECRLNSIHFCSIWRYKILEAKMRWHLCRIHFMIFYCRNVSVTDDRKFDIFNVFYFTGIVWLRNMKLESCGILTRGWSKNWKGTWHFKPFGAGIIFFNFSILCI